MKRSKFLKMIGTGSLAIAAMPVLLRATNDVQREVLEELNPELLFSQQSNKEYLLVRLYDEHGIETEYKGYAPFKAPRNRETWEVKGSTVKNNVPFTFTECKGGENIIKFFGITDEEGAVFYQGQLSNDLVLVKGVTPKFEKKAITITED